MMFALVFPMVDLTTFFRLKYVKHSPQDIFQAGFLSTLENFYTANPCGIILMRRNSKNMMPLSRLYIRDLIYI